MLLALAAFLAFGEARAHQVGLSRGEYVLARNVVAAKLTFARNELVPVVPALDEDRDGRVTEDEVTRARPALARAMTSGLLLRGNGQSCPGTFDDARLDEEDALDVAVHFACPTGPVRLEIDVRLVAELPRGHRHLVHVAMGSITIDEVATREHPVVDAVAPSGAAQASPGDAAGFFGMGFEHILTGYDHMLFLLGLTLVGLKLRPLVVAVTAFTLAHSTTLALAALGVLLPSPRYIEPLIALSVAYVGVENFFVKNADRRWLLTFPFGLVHGFAFAGALREIEVPRDRLLGALVSFNVGVEAGQLALLVVLIPALTFLRRYEGFVPRGVQALSGAVALAGAFWFLERLVHGG